MPLPRPGISKPQQNKSGSMNSSAPFPPAWWRPDRFARKRKNLEARSELFAAIRSYFDREDFLEVDTPTLQISPGMEPHLSAFGTDYITPRGEKCRLYLCTSPEFSCKKLLVAGMPRIYEMRHVFRNNEGSSRHHPEFTLLEWYRTGAGYDELMADCAALLRICADVTGLQMAQYRGMNCDMRAAPERISVADAFTKYTGIDLLATLDDPHNPDTAMIAAEAKRIGVRVAEGDEWEAIVLNILAERIEPHMGKDRPVFLMDYPLPMAALARAKPGDGRVAERFELYVAGLELANAFVELTDAKIQRARFEADAALKKKLYGIDMPIDEDFLAALEYGMPDAAGIALGVDRLVMLSVGSDNIDDVTWAPIAYVNRD
jgi:lysyl-tRNA synthetase class 2